MEVTEAMRLGYHLAHRSNHQTPHKWMCVAWRDAEANATTGTVYQGDKKKGKAHYSQFCASYVPDIIKVSGKPELSEIKNYSCWVHPTTAKPGVTSLNGGVYAFGNTEERLKHRVLGAKQKGVPAMGAFDHNKGTGFLHFVFKHIYPTPSSHLKINAPQ